MSEHAGRISKTRKPRPRKTKAAKEAEGAERGHTHALIERVAMINRIHAALRSTLNVDDIYSIILTNLISRTALNFSRAILLAYDEAQGVFRVRAALGAPSRADHLRLQKEIVDEEAYLADMVVDLRKLDEPSGDEESLFGKSLRELSSHSFWITTYQKYSADGTFFKSLEGIEIPYPMRQANTPRARVRRCRFFDHVLTTDSAKIFTRSELLDSDLPPALVKLLPTRTLWGGIKAQRGLRLMLIADRLYNEEALQPIDLLHVDWFIGQVSLALENAEMFKASEVAYLELRELDRMKSNFLSTISHELRTPLTAITGYVQLLLGNRVGEVSTGQKEVLERILSHSDLLVGKVNDLIEIAEMDSGRASELTLEAIDPLHVLMTVMPRVEAHRLRKNVKVEPVVAGAIPPIRANTEALGRIFFHLLDNAIKFSHNGGEVHVAFKVRERELRISVLDQGIGISRDQIKDIFHLFYQVDNQLTRSYEGMGIGLSIIKKYLDATGGRVEVDSEPAHGSTFTIVYPLA